MRINYATIMPHSVKNELRYLTDYEKSRSQQQNEKDEEMLQVDRFAYPFQHWNNQQAGEQDKHSDSKNGMTAKGAPS